MTPNRAEMWDNVYVCGNYSGANRVHAIALRVKTPCHHRLIAANHQLALAVYLHIPFCRTRCTYCAFNTYTGLSDQIAPYMQALRRELTLVAGTSRPPVSTIYFGGGTPSLLPGRRDRSHPANLRRSVLAHAGCRNFTGSQSRHGQSGLSAPSPADRRQPAEYRNAVGARAGTKTFRSRASPGRRAKHRVRWHAPAGFDNINLDLIYGIPRQTLDMWRHSLETRYRAWTPTIFHCIAWVSKMLLHCTPGWNSGDSARARS